MNQAVLAAIASLMVVAIAFTVGVFSVRRERAHRTARGAAGQKNPRTAAVA
jgi:hypothetical protein